MDKFLEVARERMDFINAHIGRYDVSNEVRELLAMTELMDALEPSALAYDVIHQFTGYTASQLSSYALEVQDHAGV